jgi:hypothetical protein
MPNNDYTETVLFAKVYHKELHNKIDCIQKEQVGIKLIILKHGESHERH